jgi:hypothetical protein
MGPLFSALVVGSLAVAVFAAAFAGALIFLPTRTALMVSISACIGAGVGVVAAAVAALPIVGIGGHLESFGAVAGYLSALGSGGLIAGFLSARAYLRRRHRAE